MSGLIHLLVFRLDDWRYALPLDRVDRVVRAVDVTPLRNAPQLVLGAIDVEGRVLPVLNLRRRLGLPLREITPVDWFLLARTARRRVVLVVDGSEGVVERPIADVVPPDQIVPGVEHLLGVVRLEDGLVLIHDLDRFLSIEQARTLDDALAECARSSENPADAASREPGTGSH